MPKQNTDISVFLPIFIAAVLFNIFLLEIFNVKPDQLPSNSIKTFSEFLINSSLVTDQTQKSSSNELQPWGCQVNWSNLIQERNLTRLTTAKSLDLKAPTYQETFDNFNHEKSLHPDDFIEYELAIPNTSIWQPKNCLAGENGTPWEIAIIISFREREEQLRYLLYYLFPLLQKQKHKFSIYVIEQDFPETMKKSEDSTVEKALFNRAKLFNIGYIEALKDNPNFNCFTFQDVDLIAENENVTYACNEKHPRHLSSSINKFDYKILPNPKMFGGVSQMTDEQFKKVNGYSNNFWGWGGEDDQMFKRLNAAGYELIRPGLESRWYMIPHEHESANKANPNRRSMVKKSGPSDWKEDGLSSLEYKVLKKEVSVGSLYTKISVDIFAPTNFEDAYGQFLDGG